MTTSEEKQIIVRVRQGEAHAFNPLVLKYQDTVFSIALKILKNRDDAEEMAQEVFIKAFRSIQSFRGESKFSTWLYTITYNACITQVRRKKIYTTEIGAIRTNDEECETEGGGQLQENRSHRLEAALKQLPEEDYTLILLYYYDDQCIDEICAITGLSESNVKVKLHRARKKLHVVMDELMKKETVWQL